MTEPILINAETDDELTTEDDINLITEHLFGLIPEDDNVKYRRRGRR
jgi:hypothetical protein